MAEKKPRRGSVLITLGVLLLAAAAILSGYSVWDEARANSNAAAALTQVEEQTAEPTQRPAYLSFPEMPMPTVTVDGYEYIGVLEVPSLELSLSIMSDWSYPQLKIAPCRYTGSAYLDNMVIAAHNYASHFGRLTELHVGDEVRFTDVDGNRFTYRVAEQEILAPTAIEEMVTGEWDLSLFTCTYGGRTRFTVRCVRVEE